MTDEPRKPFRFIRATVPDPATIRPRSRRQHRPVAVDRSPVKVRGEPLHEVWWRGKQWAVTAYGIERLDGTYAIAASRLTEDWLEHMGGKVWVDPDDFATAWLVALSLHGPKAGQVRRALQEQVVPHSWDDQPKDNDA